MSVVFGVRVGGANVSDIALVEGFEVNRSTDEAVTTAQIQFQQRLNAGDKFAARAWTEWTPVEIYDTATSFIHFSGYASEIGRTQQDNEKFRIDMRCVDHAILLDRRVSASLFETATDREIVYALIAETGQGIAGNDTNIAFTNSLEHFDCRDMTCREAMERLCEITGCRWHVDPAKFLRYYKPGTRFAPFNLSDTPDYTLSYPYRMTSFNRSFASAANRITFLGAGTVKVTREDTASIGTHGVIEAVKIDRQVGAVQVGSLLADAELAQRANPRISGRAALNDPPTPWVNIQLGVMIGIKSALYGIDANYLVHSMKWSCDAKARIGCEIEFGEREADLITTIRQLMREDTKLPAAVIGPDTEIPAENITGVIDASHIGGVAAENILGTIVADQIGTVHGETIIGSIGGPGSTVDVYGQSITGAITGEDVTIGATQITGVIVGPQLADQILDSLRLVGPQMGVVERIPSSSSLPILPHLEYPEGSVVMWNAIYGVSVYGTARYGSVLYKVSGGTWVKTSASAQLTGLIQYSDIVSIQAAQITGLIIASQIGTVSAESIVGIIQGDQIGTINASSITSVNAAAITGPISAANITSLNAGDITMITKWDETRIQSVNASSITAGTITATVRMTSPDIDVTSTGQGYRLQLNTTLGMKITATGTTRTAVFTNSQIRVEAASGDYAQFWEYGMDAAFPDGGRVQCGAFSGQAIVHVQNTVNGAGVQLNAFPSGVATFSMSGPNGATMNVGGDILTTTIAATQYRAANAGGLTINLNPTKSINVYDTGGTLLGRIPVF